MVEAAAAVEADLKLRGVIGQHWKSSPHSAEPFGTAKKNSTSMPVGPPTPAAGAPLQTPFCHCWVLLTVKVPETVSR